MVESDYIDGNLHGHRTEFNEDGSIDEESDWIHGVQQEAEEEEEEEQ